ncbi:hypothetical protein [Saccharicrinis aurantiacus]|uniref:hypothetical protein n=1 Tax=Saccharicrinis aurantiacus TaxID=1849719 RepID=UPI0009501A64|nr:hypothetical protein [Saccharicrinis aurantiacus]
MIRVLRMTEGKWKKKEGFQDSETFYIQVLLKLDNSGTNTYWKRTSNIIDYVVIQHLSKKNKYITNEELEYSLNSSIKLKDYEASVAVLNELVRRNPYNTMLYNLRMRCNSKLRAYKDVMIDSNKLSSYIYR